MELTYEQQQDYNNLTEKEKRIFKFHSEMHPNWTFDRVIVQLQCDIKMEEMLDNTGGRNVNQEDPIFWKEIFYGLRELLSNKFKSISQKVYDTIDRTITSIKEMIAAGIKNIGNLFDNLF